MSAYSEEPLDTDNNERGVGWHELHVSHLVMGIAFVGIALVWLLSGLGVVPDADLRLLLPWPFLLAGGLGLFAVLLRQRRQR